jgi:hypothetical protein
MNELRIFGGSQLRGICFIVACPATVLSKSALPDS